jgi:hypothetical protein
VYVTSASEAAAKAQQKVTRAEPSLWMRCGVPAVMKIAVPLSRALSHRQR